MQRVIINSIGYHGLALVLSLGCSESPSGEREAEEPDATTQSTPQDASQASCGDSRSGLGCAGKLAGYYAVRTVYDVWWRDEVDPDYPLVDPGRGELTVYTLAQHSGDCVDGTTREALVRICGLEVPTFVSYAGCRAFQLEFPDRIWDAPEVPETTASSRATSSESGPRLEFDGAIGLLGFSLSDLSTDWPVPAQTPLDALSCPQGTGLECFPDHDGDGQPGVTVQLGKLGETFATKACAQDNSKDIHYSGLLLDPSALVPPGISKTQIEAGMRVGASSAALLSGSCDAGFGEAPPGTFDVRLWSCELSDGTQCSSGEAGFADRSLPRFHFLAEGVEPPDSVQRMSCECPEGCGGSKCPLGGGPSPGPRSTFVRRGDLGDSFKCADVRETSYRPAGS